MTIDAASVTALLARHIDPSLRCTAVARAAVGNGQETWLVDAVDGDGTQRDFVLRRSAVAGVLDDTDRAHEFETLRQLSGQGLPTPAVHWLETEPSSLTRPFFVMDRLPGRPPAPASPEDTTAIARDLGRRLAQLHAAGLGAVEDVRETTLREITRWKQRYRERRVGVLPMIGALLAWLEVNLPSDDAPSCLLWGDAGPHNVLVENNTISAMLDWELSHVGHPLEDLGAAVWACLGRYPQDEVIAGYESVTGEPVDRSVLAYFAVLGCVTRSIMQLAGVDSFVRGTTNALNLAGLGLTLPIANLRRAAAYARWPADPIEDPLNVAPDDELRLRPDVTETLAGIARFLREDVLPATGPADLRRGLKTANGLLLATAQRSREEPFLRAALDDSLDALFDQLRAAGVVPLGGSRTALALEEAAVRVETDPAFAGLRAAVRQALYTDLTSRAASLSAITRMYGADVTAGRGFHDPS